MHYLHTMVRVRALEASLDFYCDKLGLRETRRQDVPAGRFTLVFLATSEDIAAAGLSRPPEIELTYNWDGDETYQTGRSWGHLAFTVEDIYAVCEKLRAVGIPINRPPRDGHMAFVKSPDGVSIELLQQGEALPVAEPWASMPNVGSW